MDKNLHLELALLANELKQQADFIDHEATVSEDMALVLRRRSEELRAEADKLTKILAKAAP